MPIQAPFNFKQWIEEHRHLLKPPVGNQVVYKPDQDFIVMVVGGPNSRKDFHYNETEEFYYQIEGDITVRIIEEGGPRNIEIKEGDIFLLPAKIPHSPQRGPNTVGLVMEAQRRGDMKDGFQWYCENCNHLIHAEYYKLEDIVKQLPVIMNGFFSDIEKRTCDKCGTIMAPPK